MLLLLNYNLSLKKEKVQPLQQRLNLFFAATVLSLGVFFCANITSAATISKPPNNLGLVGYWPFDEGTGTIAHDFSGNGNNGILTSGPTSTSGKRGKAVSFDGTDDRVVVPDSPTTNLSTNITMSAWFYNRQWKESDIFEKGGPGGYMIWLSPANANHIVCGQQNGNINNDMIQSVTDFSNRLNEWIHIICTYDGANFKFYVNGVLDNSAARTTSFNNSSPLQIGNGDDGKFNGLIDDTRIYNRAISAAEIANLYKIGSAKLSSTNPAKGTLANGLVGWWTMDGKDMNWTTGRLTDVSGTGNTGIVSGMATATAPVSGKINQALNFKYTSNSYVRVPGLVVSSYPFTISSWFKLNSNKSGNIVGLTRAAGSGVLTSRYELYYYSSGGVCLYAQDNNNGPAFPCINSVPIGQWVFGTAVFTSANSFTVYLNGANPATSVSTANFDTPAETDIGADADASNYFDGQIDDSRIYNRALSATEVKQLYNIGAGQKVAMSDVGKGTLSSGQVGYWSFNNKDLSWTSNTAFDRSGRGNNGMMINMSTTSSPVIGKIGQALKFNGVNNNVTVLGNSTINDMSQKSACAWIKPNGSGDIITKSDNVNNAGSGWNFFLSGTTLRYYQGHCGGSDMDGYGPGVPLNTWSHVCFSHDDSSNSNPVMFYLNGVESGFGGTGAATKCGDTSYDIHIGSADAANDNPFLGLIDDVRVFNRIISANEAKQIYNSGR